MSSHKPLIKKISQMLAGKNAFVVGGAIRDRLLNRTVWDIDLALESEPARLAEVIAKKLAGTTFTLDKDLGVHRISLPGHVHIDLAKFQGASLTADLKRRDFSINAMAIPVEHWGRPDWDKYIIDPHHGLKALKGKQVSALARTNIIDDPLRILRAFRIALELGFSITPHTLKILQKERNRLKKPAPERIREELLKIFASPLSYPTLVVMDKIGLWDVLLPEARRLRRTAFRYYGKGGVLKHTFDAIRFLEDVIRDVKPWFPRCHKRVQSYLETSMSGYPRSAHLKWAALLHDLGKPGTAKMIGGRLRFFEHEHVGAHIVMDMAPRFRWSTEETNCYVRMTRNHMRPGNLAAQIDLTDKAIHRFFRDLGDDAVGVLIMALGDHLANLTPRQRKFKNTPHERLTQKMIQRYYSHREKVLPPRLLNGHDIMKAFKLPPSPLIGTLLKDLTEAQSERGFKSKDEGLQYLRGRLPFHTKNT